MRFTPRLLPAFALILFCLFSVEARADEITITGGSATMRLASGSFSFAAECFAANGSLGFGALGAANCSPCVAGNSISLSARYLGGDIVNVSARVSGIDHGRVFTEGELLFSGNLVIPPADPALSPDQTTITLTVPFTFTGSLSGCAQSTHSAPCPGGPLFNTTLNGRGLATLQLWTYYDPHLGQRFYSFNSVRYDFHAPEPVPEPATLLLLGTGLAGIAARYRRRRRSSPER